MARRSYEGGGRRSNDNFVAMIAGGFAASILDYFWISNKLYGYNQKIGTVSSKAGAGRKVPITMSDYAQLGLSTVLGSYGFLRAGSSSRIPAFSFGMAITQILTKFVFPASGVPRYVVYDIDDNGNLTTTLPGR